MIAGLFLNSPFLLVAAALISLPIIIHLINRMRFQRIQWAAMEFLLKAQKRTQRRLIIEQLLLLALRCLLIGLVGFLVLRFTGCGDNSDAGKPNRHIVLLDDTLSMRDKNPGEGAQGGKTCFQVATQEFLIDKIGKGLGKSKTNDELVVIQLSRCLDSDYKPLSFKHLNDTKEMDDFKRKINGLAPSLAQVDLIHGIEAAKKLIGSDNKNRVSLHILSDYRHVDWSGKTGEKLNSELVELVKANKEIKIRAIDTVSPARDKNQAASTPPARDNVGIVSFRPSARVVGHKMPVRFHIRIANYGSKQAEVILIARDEDKGRDLDEVDFNPPTRPLVVPAGGEPIEVTFDYGSNFRGQQPFFADLKEGQVRFANLSVRLATMQKQDLTHEVDGLLEDNKRYTFVEVREKVPVLIIDGAGADGRKEGKDSFILDTALRSVPGGSFKVVFADELPDCRNNPLKALERADLRQYASIFLLNVQGLQWDDKNAKGEPINRLEERKKNPNAYPKSRQITNLENYVKDGGGVVFYLGKDVQSYLYNEDLYRNGKGIFPAPLESTYFPSPDKAPRPIKKDNDTFELITREDKFPGQPVPIFGAIFEEAKQREPLANLPIHRYFKVNRDAWVQGPNVMELATLPNEAPARASGERVVRITEKGKNIQAVLGNEKFAKYKARLSSHIAELQKKSRDDAQAEYKGYHLASQIDAMLTDRGSADPKDNLPDLTAFWANPDERVQALKAELIALREDVQYGDPFVVAQEYPKDMPKGRVVAVMSTLGREWNDWSGGSTGSVIFMPFIWEMQNYLTGARADDSLTVGSGSTIPLSFDAGQFKKDKKLKIVRTFRKPEAGKPATPVVFGEETIEASSGAFTFTLAKHLEPGLYVSEIFDPDVPNKSLGAFGHAFNVNTLHEGKLQRMGSEAEAALLDAAKKEGPEDAVQIVGPNAPEDKLVPKTQDLSESPWLFLILLLVLIAEQALAVHLSFHLKQTEEQMAAAGARAESPA
ncbi:MAG: hypothetical protein FJ303_05835 [Planctomycetes bacterium]|nr:hypothetical protein [Planctomycetota bacterium]